MKWNWEPFLDICLVSICGIIRAEIDFHPWTERINQILYDCVGWQHHFTAIQKCQKTQSPAQPSLLSCPVASRTVCFTCHIMCSQFGYFPLPEGRSDVTIALCDERGALSLNLNLSIHTKSNNRGKGHDDMRRDRSHICTVNTKPQPTTTGCLSLA